MAHILCITSGLTGILHSSFELIERLNTAGHQVTYASPKSVEEKVQAQGIAYIQLNPLELYTPAPLPDFKGPFKKVQRIWTRYQRASETRRLAIEALGMDHFKKVLEENKPDFLIIDVELHEYIMTVYALKIPLALLSQWFSLWKRPGLPPLVRDIIPGAGWKGSAIGMELTWNKIKFERWRMFLKKKLLSFGTNRRSVLKAYAKQISFPEKFIPDNFWPGPFTYSSLPVISMTAKEMEFPHDVRPALYYVGPMVHTKRRQTEIDPFTNERLQHIFKQNKAGKSLIYCSVSTFKKGDNQFLHKLINAVKKQKDWLLILGLGGLMEAQELGELPSNVFAFSWVPQLKVLAVADCSINHGGVHTINECLHYKVPMLVYSGKKSDQDGCAARVAYHKVGIMADKDVDTINDINRNIQAILGDPVYRKNITAFHQQIERYRSEKVLEKTIEKLMTEQGVHISITKEENSI